MPKVRVRPKNQITIPLRIAEEAGIKPDDVLDITYMNGLITMVPAGKKGEKRPIMKYAGIARGTCGKTSGEIEETLKTLLFAKELLTVMASPDSLQREQGFFTAHAKNQ